MTSSRDLASVFLLSPNHSGFLDGSARQFRDQPSWFTPLMLVMGIGSLIVGLGFFLFGFSEFRLLDQLNRQGIVTSASVTDLTTWGENSSLNSRSKTHVASYMVSYSFQANGQAYYANQTISQTTYDNLQGQTQLDIRYLPNDPATSRYLNGADTSLNSMMMMMGAVLLVVEGVLVGYFVWRIRRASRLSRDGQVLVGQIRPEADAVKIGNKARLTVKYQFRTPSGAELTGKAMRKRLDLYGKTLPKAGDQVAILYVSDSLYDIL